MKKRLQPTIIAFLVLVILLVYANYYEVDEVLPPGMQKPQPILKFAADRIDAIAWPAENGKPLKITRGDAGFKIVEPGDFATEKAEVDGIIRHVVELKSEMVVSENASDTSAYGLTESSPALTVSAGQDAQTLLLGAKSPVGGSFYLKVKNEPKVYLVPGYIRGDFFKTIQDLRQKAIFPEPFVSIESIELVSGNEKIVLQKKDAIEWFIVEPVQMSADPEAIANLVQTFQDLRVSRFVDDAPENPEEWGFASAAFKISMKNRSGKEFALETGEYAGTETYFRLPGNPAIHAFLKSDLEKLRKSVNDLRTKILPELDLKKLQAITLRHQGKTISISRNDKSWEVNGKVIETPVIDSFLSFYDQARVSVFMAATPQDLEKNRLDKPQTCDSLTLVYPDNTNEFLLGKVQGVNLSLLHDEEILVVNSELQTAFTRLIEKIGENSENSVVSGNDN